jgi:hypothetical protein
MKKFLASLAVAGVVLTGTAGVASATQPNPEHKVTICHATPPDTAANGWNSITVDVASVGYQHSGHQDEHAADIIPAWSYTDGDGNTVSYEGKNLATVFQFRTGADILGNGCVPEPCDTVDADGNGDDLCPPPPPPVDVCPNIPGNQTDPPVGWFIDPNDGNCVARSCDNDSEYCPPPVEASPSVVVSVDCGGYDVDWADFPSATPQDIYTTVTYENVTDNVTTNTQQDLPDDGGANVSGRQSYSHPLLTNQHVTVHSTWTSNGGGEFNSVVDLTNCEAPSDPPPTTPPTTTPTDISTAKVVVAPTLPVGTDESLPYTGGGETLQVVGAGVAMLLAGFLLLGKFRGWFPNSKVLFGKIANA